MPYRRQIRQPRLSRADRVRHAVRSWWRGRLMEGRIFASDGPWEADVDYIGNLPWPYQVRGEALFQDYASTSMIPTSRQSFYKAFRAVSEIRKATPGRVAVRTETGRPLYTVSRVFYDLPPLDISRRISEWY